MGPVGAPDGESWCSRRSPKTPPGRLRPFVDRRRTCAVSRAGSKRPRSDQYVHLACASRAAAGEILSDASVSHSAPRGRPSLGQRPKGRSTLFLLENPPRRRPLRRRRAARRKHARGLRQLQRQRQCKHHLSFYTDDAAERKLHYSLSVNFAKKLTCYLFTLCSIDSNNVSVLKKKTRALIKTLLNF